MLYDYPRVRRLLVVGVAAASCAAALDALSIVREANAQYTSGITCVACEHVVCVNSYVGSCEKEEHACDDESGPCYALGADVHCGEWRRYIGYGPCIDDGGCGGLACYEP